MTYIYTIRKHPTREEYSVWRSVGGLRRLFSGVLNQRVYATVGSTALWFPSFGLALDAIENDWNEHRPWDVVKVIVKKG